MTLVAMVKNRQKLNFYDPGDTSTIQRYRWLGLHDSGRGVLDDLRCALASTDFTTKGQKVSRPPPNSSPRPSQKLFALFFGAALSVFHFSDDVLNPQNWCALSGFSTEHPSLQITPSAFSAVRCSPADSARRKLREQWVVMCLHP